MDLYEYIKNDHEIVSGLFERFETAELAQKKLIIKAISEELLVHLESEHDTFYKALLEFEETENLVKHGADEHSDIEERIWSVLKNDSYDEEWGEKVNKLKEAVEHHVAEEEGKIHSKAQEVLSDEEAEHIKQQMDDLKKEYKEKIQENIN